MAVFTVSFTIAKDATYDVRYKSFTEQVKKTGVYWEETTSFIVVETGETIADFCNRIYLNSDFNASTDRYLVLDANVKSGLYRGVLADKDLLALLPYVKKL